MLILEFLISGSFIVAYCLAIVAFLATVIFRLRRETRPLKSKLNRWSKKINRLDGEQEFAQQFESYNSGMLRDFGTPWDEFVETLILPAPKSSDPIRNTRQVSRHLNDSTIIFPQLSFDFYRSVPNLLTGLGILGTFIGLAAGVGAASSGLSSSDPAEITASLQRLLGGAALAFITSIAGLVSSMAFVFVERRTSRRLHRAVDTWVGAVESCLRRVTLESVALKQLVQAEQATTHLERFNTQLIFSLEQALEEKIANRLSPQLEQLISVVEGLRSDRSSDAGRMIEHALSEFTQAMRKRTESQFSEMGEVVSQLNQALTDSAERMAGSERDMRGALDSLVTTVKGSMDAGAAAMTETLEASLTRVTGEIAEASAELAEQLTASSSTAAARLQDTLGTVTREIAETGTEAAAEIFGSLRKVETAALSLERSASQSENVLGAMTPFVTQLNDLRSTIDAALGQFGNLAGPIGRAAREIRDSSERAAQSLAGSNQLVDRLVTVAGNLEEHQKLVAGAWDRYQERFEGIDHSLAQVFEQIDDGLSGYCEQVKKFANELDRTTAGTIQHLAGATQELGGSIEDLIEALPRPAG